jgi:cation diffusion facilitator family transporter
MITLLRKLFIKDYANVKDERVRASHGKVAAIFGIVSNLILVVMKLAVAFLLAYGLYTASADPDVAYLSLLPMALVGDAVNNLADMASSIVTLVGFKFASKPADEEHPFGHERIEYIAGLVVSVIVIVLAVELLRDSITKVVEGSRVTYDLVTIIILAVSVALKLLQGYVNFGFGKAISSEALKATALDSLTDAIATAVIMISGVLSYTVGWDFLDGYMGIVVALFVAYSGIKMLKTTASPLIGERTSSEFLKPILKDVLAHKEILGVHDVICHSYGPTKYFVSLHAEINQDMPMVEAHDIIDNIEEEIRHKHRCDITIHMDPVAVGDPKTDTLRKRVQEILLSLSKDLTFHDFRIVAGPTHTNIVFDVVLPFDGKVAPKLVYETLEKEMKDDGENYHFVIHFDRPYSEK